jgi:AraC-like DNA-binding protein
MGVIYMSVINENISIKIREVRFMSWDIASVSVSARPYHALVFRLCGSASFSHENLNSSTNVGDVFYMPANYSYKATYQKKNEILVIHFESDLISKMENYQLNDSHIISILFHRLYDIWNKKEDGYYYSALSVMCEILENISVQQSPSLRSETMKAFEDAVEYMEKNYTSNECSVKEMVEKAHMSNTYFRKLFFNKFSMTPTKYLVSKRLIHAEKLLSTGKYSIKEVAEMSGFCDVKYFSRVVKKEYGVPPSKLYCHITKN